MTHRVMLSIRGTQRYRDQEPDVIELVTDGEMEFSDGGWTIGYDESTLTGLTGVHTTFRVEPDRLILTRVGPLRSRMVFRLGITDESLYQTEFGALMISVRATSLFYDITPDGGVIDLAYEICIEQEESGEIDYHLDIRTVS